MPGSLSVAPGLRSRRLELRDGFLSRRVLHRLVLPRVSHSLTSAASSRFECAALSHDCLAWSSYVRVRARVPHSFRLPRCRWRGFGIFLLLYVVAFPLAIVGFVVHKRSMLANTRFRSLWGILYEREPSLTGVAVSVNAHRSPCFDISRCVCAQSTLRRQPSKSLALPLTSLQTPAPRPRSSPRSSCAGCGTP
jgi:hypothetical protein